MRKTIPFDVETTTILNGSPYHKDNRLVAVGIGEYVWYKHFGKYIQQLVNNSILVGHNIKFDIAWLRRIGIDFSKAIIRDTQLAEFIISNQTKTFSKLDDLALQYLGEQKLDIVKTEYWDKGIDTWFVPEPILLEYLEKDLDLTLRVFKVQEQILKDTGKWNLFVLQCADLLELQDMEWNGILFNKEKSIENGDLLQQQMDDLTSTILKYTACPTFNCNSGDHLSCLLYGGTISVDTRIPVGEYKTGQKIGQTRYKILVEKYIQERLVEPLKGSELKKKGYYSIDEATLLSLKPKTKEVKQLIANILQLSKLDKLQNTYFYGIPKLSEEQGWDEYLHGQFNQCVVRTGRLSSSKPNLQNFDPQLKQLCTSRYL